METNKTVAYWNIYDSESGALLQKEKEIARTAMPSEGALLIGIPGKFNAVVRNFKFKGIKGNLPCYDVYV